MASNLDSYRAKRNFSATPEPSGDADESAAERTSRFVVQEHHARSLHWDLRLEREGTLASWAVPKGIPPDPRKNHLAVQTEDHPLEYLDFHGEIPAGQYGAGTMQIWDRGTYETHKWRDKEVMVTFHGERAVRPEQVEAAAVRGRHAGAHESGAIERCELRSAF
jgi:bifunctional non-homologous end joining protein LigD